MFFQVIAYNLIALIFAGMAGYFPARLLQRKVPGIQGSGFLFAALLLGYFIAESILAVWITRGSTMQWLNGIPTLSLFFLPDQQEDAPMPKEQKAFLLIPFVVLLFSSWYFLRSYSTDLQSIDRYPFIDIVSYAGTAFGMQHSGSEVTFVDAAIYNPSPGAINLYHFTELWAAVGFSKLFSVTELWAMCFLVPVFLLVVLSTGLASFLSRWNLPLSFALILVGSLIYSNSKLLLFDDVFFYNLLDLCGLKISLIIPVFLFLYSLRQKPQVFLLFLLWLPQVNVLLSVLMASVFGLYFLMHLGRLRKAVSWPVWMGYLLFGVGFLFLAAQGKGNQSGPELLAFSTSLAVRTFFTYLREALFNLGFNYWLFFLLVAAALVQWKYVLLALPYVATKVLVKILVMVFPSALPLVAGMEVMFFFILLFGVNHRFRIFPNRVYLGLLVLCILCLVGGIGYAFTGFMDFEQIYTLFACSSFFILILFLFEDTGNGKGWLSFVRLTKFQWIAGSVVLVFVAWKTFRFQRVLPFDTEFYSEISRELDKDSGPKFSAYFSTRKYLPFPLHIKAGFPLLFRYPTAISTPMSMFEDSSWRGKDIEWHVTLFPFYAFCLAQPGFHPPDGVPELQARFLKEKGIRYLWFDKDYVKNNPGFNIEGVRRKIVSATDPLEFWILDTEQR